MIFKTKSGSKYEILYFEEDQSYRVRRVNDAHPKRGDRGWWLLLNTPDIEVGEQALLVMESLSHLGPDDEGNEGGGATVRVTSEVVEIDLG